MTTRAILWMAVSSAVQAEDDKESLPEQESKLRQAAEREGWQIVDLILVPGHSRVYYNYPEFAEAALKDAIPGPTRMFDHWRKRDFDIFACIDGSRWGREQSIFAEVVARTLDTGAQVFTLKDGYIHKGNQRMFVSMAGYSAASEIDELMRRKAFGMRGRAQRGLPTAPKLPLFQKIVFDERGKQTGTVVNEDLRRLWDDAAEVVLAGTAWKEVESVLYQQYGHRKPDGKHFRVGYFYDCMMNPAWWGHDAINHQYKDDRRTRTFLPWIWDESQPAPLGVQVFRNTHPAVYTGLLAARVKAELWRRHTVVKGRASSNSYRFTGLLVCNECGYTMSVSKKAENAWVGYRCMTCFRGIERGRVCSQRRTVNDKAVQAYLNDRLEDYFAGLTTHFFDDMVEPEVDSGSQITRLEVDLDGLTEERRVIMRQQRKASEDAQDGYREQVEELSEQMAIVRQRLDLLRMSTADKDREIADREQALSEIKDETLPVFWAKSAREVNQQLHRIMRSRRIVVETGVIKGVLPVARTRAT